MYLEYLNCPKNMWLKCHKPELNNLFERSEFEKNLGKQGDLVELFARKLFPDGMLIDTFGHNAALSTSMHAAKKTPVLFQSTFIFDGFLARNDVLVYDSTIGKWHLYEIKGTASIKEASHVEDATFQAIILKESRIELDKISIIHLNKEYILDDSLDIDRLFVITDITNKVEDHEQETRLKMKQAKAALSENGEDNVDCTCIFKARGAHCPTFQYSHSHVPEYSIHDIARINEEKVTKLVNIGCFSIDDIPDDFKLTETQKNQVNAYKQQTTFVETDSIKRELDALTYPLYFLDYETYAPAIPRFKGYKPYDPITFQLSLHVLHGEENEPTHFEYLHESDSDPSLSVIRKLQEYIRPKGTIIVWYKSFEKTRNAELAERHPIYKEFLEDVNDRVYDLMDIFAKQLYVHPRFKGSSSIKKVLPALSLKLSYEGLSIQDGACASIKWFDMVYGNLQAEEKQKIAQDLRKYCGLDSYAMFAIWKHLVQR